jgi:integrase
MRHLIASDATIRSAIATALGQESGGAAVTPRQLRDGDGLYLLLVVKGRVAPAWRFDYTAATRKTLSLGTYPDTGLAAARRKAEEFRRLVAGGSDPSSVRKAAKDERKRAQEATKRVAGGLPALDSFEAVARELHAAKAPTWSQQYAERWIDRMAKDLFPSIGALQLPAITPPLLLKTLRAIEARGAHETAHTLLQTAGQVFRYGIHTGRCERNPTPDLRGALKPIVVKNMSAATDPIAAGGLLRAIAAYQGSPLTRGALRLSALLFQRPGNIRAMKWAAVDLEAAMWTIPSAEMKRRVSEKLNGRPHLVPLSRQALEILAELQPLSGRGVFVFPSLHTGERCMSENTVNVALRRMGLGRDEATAHGFRAMARTLLVERLGVDPEVVEAQLAHGKSGPLGSAYDRAEYLDLRRVAMQRWADYLDQLEKGGRVMPIKAA